MTRIVSSDLTMPHEVGVEILAFLLDECAALDEQRFDDWMNFLHDDYEYRVPVPMARDDWTRSRYDETSVLAWESKSSLRYRFERYQSDFAWADRPGAFLRHFVCNVRVEPDGQADDHLVRSNVLVVRSRLPEEPTMVSAGRVDVITRTQEGNLRLLRRTVHLDTERPTATQLAILY